MARRKFVAGNWKMFTSARSGVELATAVAKAVTSDAVQVAVCPPFPYLAAVRAALVGSRVALGAQNLYPAKEGAFTGEVSPDMLRDVGCDYVILGHSERRHGLGETDAFINQKVRAALTAGLKVIFCVGETLQERNQGRNEEVVAAQITASLQDFPAASLPSLTIAYEPVWAIGTGVNATPEQAQTMHAFIRRQISGQFGPAAGEQLVIQYGGSVKPDNAVELMRQPDVDGALVGGASLKADSFLAIVNAAG